MTMPILVTVADRSYVEAAKQLFSSAYFNAGWNGDYMLFAHDIPEAELQWFKERGILIRRCTPLASEEVQGFPPVVLSKFYLFTIEMKRWDNVVYLDPDIIIKAPIDSLARVKGFSAALDLQSPAMRDQILYESKSTDETEQTEHKTSIAMLHEKFHPDEPVFNTGVMVFSTSIINNNTFGDLLRVCHKYLKLTRFGEQGVINLFFYKQWKRLSFAYNLCPDIFIKRYGIDMQDIRSVILHFSDRNKPWLPDNIYHKEWKRNLEKADAMSVKVQRNKRTFNSRRKIYSARFYASYLRFLCAHDRHMGLLGNLIKKHAPKLHNTLKRRKNE